MTVIVPGECTCDCHVHREIRHDVPCCETCPHCLRHIVRMHYDEHVAECTSTLEAWKRYAREL